MSKSKDAGLRERHTRSCLSKTGGRCNCKPTWEASVWDAKAQKRLTHNADTKTAAKKWRVAAQVSLAAGTMSADRGPRLEEALEKWLDAMRAGLVTNRSGARYKPGAIRGYEQALRLRVIPVLGDRRMRDVEPKHVQAMIDDLVRAGWSASTIEAALTPLRAFYRRAVNRGDATLNPTLRIEKPGVESAEKVTASPTEAAELLELLDGPDRTLWALAFYAGLRRGELIALRWEDIDLTTGLIHCRRGWDDMEGEITPKSRKGVRRVPIPGVLRVHLLEHRLRSEGDGRLFESMSWVQRCNLRARRVWLPVNAARLEKDPQAALLPILVLHGARHTFASLMIAAGVNAKALSTYMGHANIAVTLDRYGHLMPGNEEEAAELLDAYLRRAAGDA